MSPSNPAGQPYASPELDPYDRRTATDCQADDKLCLVFLARADSARQSRIDLIRSMIPNVMA